MKRASLQQYFDHIQQHSLNPMDKQRIFSRIQQQKYRQTHTLLSRFRHATKRLVVASVLGVLTLGLFAPYLFHTTQPLIISHNGVDIIVPQSVPGTVQASPIGTILESQGGFSIIGSSGTTQTGVTFADGDIIVLNPGTTLRFGIDNGTAEAYVQGPAKLTVTRQSTTDTTVFIINLLEGNFLSVKTTPKQTNNTLAIQTQDGMIRQTSGLFDVDIETKQGRKTVTNKGGQIAVTTNRSTETKLIAQYQTVEIGVDVTKDIQDEKIIAQNFKEKTYGGSYAVTAIDDNTLRMLSRISTPAASATDPTQLNTTSPEISESNEITATLSTAMIATDEATTSTTTPHTNSSDTINEKRIIERDLFLRMGQLTHKSFIRNDLIDISITHLKGNAGGYAIALSNASKRISQLAALLDISLPSSSSSLGGIIANIDSLISQSQQQYYIDPDVIHNLTSMRQRLSHLQGFDVGLYSQGKASTISGSGQLSGEDTIITTTPIIVSEDTIYQLLNITPSTYSLR